MRTCRASSSRQPLALYAGLQAHLGDAAQRDALRIMLERAACIWVGSGFVPARICIAVHGAGLRAAPEGRAGRHRWPLQAPADLPGGGALFLFPIFLLPSLPFVHAF